jgi:hypothetical protein
MKIGPLLTREQPSLTNPCSRLPFHDACGSLLVISLAPISDRILRIELACPAAYGLSRQASHERVPHRRAAMVPTLLSPHPAAQLC